MTETESCFPLYDAASFRCKRQEGGRGNEIVDDDLRRSVARILARVRHEGDAALLAITKELDAVDLEPAGFRVPPSQLRDFASGASPEVLATMRRAGENVRRYHERQSIEEFELRDESGSRIGQRVLALDSVGVYVPGGAASYPSSVLMNVIPAQIAGVPRIVACTPPDALRRSPELAAALELVSADEVYTVGGAQAIAALAYGTESIAPVDKIVGPGNAYVAEAKRLVFGTVGIDGIAGPSEIVVLADAQAEPKLVAADLLSQAEHGSGDERALLVTTSCQLAEAVRVEVQEQLRTLPRASAIETVLKHHGGAIVARDEEEAIALVNEIAPEHLEILTAKPDEVARSIRHAGATFLGEHSPVPVGDFFAGPNHVLPTGGSARFASPLGVYDFVKRVSFVAYTKEKLKEQRSDIERFARAEGFEAHARSVGLRFDT